MKFGVREICDVTFKTTADGQKVGNTVFKKAGMPAFSIDTAKTSSLEQATTTVYAQGGKGYNRLIAWEGEKTMTFTVEDALISPMGLAVLSGAGLINTAEKTAHVHVTKDVNLDATGSAVIKLSDLKDETGLSDAEEFFVCVDKSVPVYATVIDGSGAGIKFIPEPLKVTGETVRSGEGISPLVKVDETNSATFKLYATKLDTDGKTEIEDTEGTAALVKEFGGATVKLDFYLAMNSGVTEVEIKPNDFGGFFYVEAQTLYRREDTGLDMAAEIIIPKVKVQSGFTFSMAASGDPSTFTFTMDAFPAYTKFDTTKKVMCVMQIIGEDATAVTKNTGSHEHSFQ